jgi:predicted phage terminase large subunit-like protein
MLFVPPRHGKSEMVTVRYPVWRLERKPELRVIIGAYNQMLANTFSRKARRIAEARLDLTDDRTAVEQWETKQGGGLRAVGVGAGITGQGGNLIIIDDPVKSREEAESETYRERVWSWYTDDLYTRLEPDGAVILIMTRWHEDDLAGRILASEDAAQWTVVSLPAEAEDNDPLGRAVGEALCPERYDEQALQDTRRVLGSRSYAALYQQRPQPPEGDVLKREWFRQVVDAQPITASRIRYWDKAATDGGGDYTVGVKMSRTPDGIFYVEDVVRGQWSSAARDTVMRQTAESDGRQVYVRWEEEPGSSGKDVSAALTKLLAGFPALPPERVTGDKVVRAGPFAAQAEAGNVRLVKGAWNRAFVEEMASFPGAHDDQVDGASGAFNALTSLVRAPLQGVQFAIRRT